MAFATIFDNIPLEDRRLQWIEGTTAGFDGYLEFQAGPILCSSGSRPNM